MSFRELELASAYDSGDFMSDVLADFYVPVLSEAVTYDRLAGYFNSTALAVAARGIAGLVLNGGTMRLAASPQLSAEDVRALECAETEAERFQVVLGAALTALSLDSLAEQIARDHLRALCWLVSQGRLQIRLIVPTRSDEASGGLYHQKVGVLRDSEGDVVSFSGSINETASGWLRNAEEFKVFRSWEKSQLPFLNHDTQTFARYWTDSSPGYRAIELSDEVLGHLHGYAPSDVESLPSWIDMCPPRRKRTPKKTQLRDYQSTAVRNWVAADCQGILAMATGTGKTKTAVAALEYLRHQGGSQLCVITAPQQTIAGQWAKDLEASKPLVLFEKTDWQAELTNLNAHLKLRREDEVCIVVVEDTARNPQFLAAVGAIADRMDRAVIVADEVHGLGASQTRQALAPFFTHRLGLSATWERYFDDEGTELLEAYFGGPVFTFGIKEALDWRDPETGLSALCPYSYTPEFIHLDGAELDDYVELTRKIIKLSGSTDDPRIRERYELLLFRRADIVKSASQKMLAFGSILDQLSGDVTHGLIYCSNESQMQDAMVVLRRRRIKYHRFTGTEGTRPSKQYRGLTERDFIIRSLDDGDIDVLVAMNCLDEGIDVPSARLGVILASSGNPRQFIQRRGRLLRRAPGKDVARIYDVIVAPNPDLLSDPAMRELERRLFGKELDRIDEFAANAANRLEVRAAVLRVLTDLSEGGCT
jgi:superfamily II DNA or RNA helicase